MSSILRPAVLASAVLVVSLAACGGSSGDDDDADAGPPRADAAPPAPLVQQDYDGTYAYTGAWDLSAPFEGDGLGGFVAELLIDQIIGLAGVPDALADEAHDLISDQLRQPIVDTVNDTIPPELYGSSPLLVALDALFSEVLVEGTLRLRAAADPDDLSGTDTVTGLAVTYEATLFPVPMAELLGGVVSVAGDFAGSATAADAIAIGEHALEIRLGELVQIVAREVLGVDVMALSDRALAALDCTDLVAAITGGDGAYAISVGGSDFSVSAAALEDACAAMKEALVGQALGMLRPDAGVSLGGPATLGDPDADRATDTVSSRPGYGGSITGLSIPVEPHLSASFVGTR